MKKKNIVLIITIILILVNIANVVKAIDTGQYNIYDGADSPTFIAMFNKVYGIVALIANVALTIGIVLAGIKYMTAAPERQS